MHGLMYDAMPEQAIQPATNNGQPTSLSLLLSSVVILCDGGYLGSAASPFSIVVGHGSHAGSLIFVMY